MSLALKTLSANDLRSLVSAIADLHGDFDPRTLPDRAMKASMKVIEADSTAFTGIGYDGELSGLYWDSSETLSAEEIEIFGHYMHEQPLFAAYVIERSTETLKITDLLPAEKFERTNIYNEFYRRVGVRNQLVSPLAVSKDLFVSCSANTSKQDFSDRQKLMSMLLAPHLVNAIRNAMAYERLNSALDAERCGIIAVASDGKPQYVSEYARSLLENYFAAEKRAEDSLPEAVSNWLKQASANLKAEDFSLPLRPLVIKNETGELNVRLMINKATCEQTLILEEKRFLSAKTLEQLNITRREAEILLWITRGKSDEAIATLCNISPRTVHKHVENIYAKLGVETRTSAMLRALEIIR